MPVLGCGAEIGKLMDVSDQDVASIEEVIAERLALGVSQAVAQRQAVDEVLAQLADERSMVMKAVQEQLVQPANDLFPEEFATPDTEGDSGVKINSKGATRKGANVNSDGKQITATKQGVDNFWKWFGDSAAADAKGRPLVLYHSTNSDFAAFEPGRETVNSTTFGDVQTQRHGIFMSPDNKFSQEYLRKGEGQNVMQVYASMQNPIDLREGINGDDLNAIIEASDGKLNRRDFNYVDPYETWTFFDDEFGKNFTDAAKAAGFDGAIMLEAGPEGNKPATTYVAFEPTQVKSATGNLGTFNPNDNRIAFANKAQIEREAYDMIEADPEGMVDSYLAKHKNVIDPDRVKEMFPAYVADPSLAAAVHEPSSKLAKMIYTEALGRNKGAPVVFTAGGGGSGKSEAMPVAMQIAGVSGAPLTYDSTLSSYSSAKQRIDQALGSKSPVLIVYTNAPVERAFQFAMRRERVVPASTLTAAHVGASNTIRRLAEHYKGNGAVRIIVVNNSGAKEDIDVGALDDVPKYEQNDIERSLYELASQARDSGQITNEKFAALMAQPRGDGGASQSSDRAVQEGYGRQELGRPGERAGSEDPGVTPFANKPTSPYRDAAGRAKFPPGVIAYKLLGKAARPFVDKLLLTRASPEARRELTKMKLEVQKAMDTTAEVATVVNKMSDEERRLISDIIEKEVKTGVTPSANAVETAAMMNEAFETQTNELVRLGMLTQEAADKWRGKYLPRYYETKLKKPTSEAWADVFGLANGRARVLAGIKGNHLKSRGLTYTVYAKDLPEWEGKGWEIRDKAYTPGDTTVQIWRDFTPKEREQMGEIRDAGFRFVMGYMQTQKDIALGRMYERVSQNPEMASKNPLGEDWVQVPDTKVPETGAMRYGKLAGMYVPKDLMLQLNNFEQTEGDFMRLYKKALSLWKEAKTVLNPVSHVNNFVSNATMAHFAGVSYWDQHKYAGSLKDLAQGLKNPMVKEARESGLFLGSFTDEEISNILPPELQAMVNKQDSKGVAAARLAYNVLTWGLRKPMQKAYEFGDSFYKYMLYKDARNRGATPEDAVTHAQSFIFTYDDLPTGARRIRDFGLPFFSYTYKAVPRLAETFLTRPDRFFAPAAVIYALGAMGYAAAAGGDDDWMESVKKYLMDADFRKKADDLQEEEYKLLPEWMKGRSALGTLKQIRLGTDEATGNPVFLDVSRFIPGGDLFDINSNAGGIPMLQPITPSNPLLSIYSTMIANKDPFFGKELVKDTDTGWEATKKRADYMWKLATPAIAAGNVHWDRATNAVASVYGDEIPYLPDALGGSNTGIGRDGQPVQPKYAAMQSVGIKARPLDFEMSQQIQTSQKNKTLRELEAELAQARRYRAKGIMSDRMFDKREEYIRTKMDNVREGLTVSGSEK
jgi:hypothetical protein